MVATCSTLSNLSKGTLAKDRKWEREREVKRIKKKKKGKAETEEDIERKKKTISYLTSF